MTHHRLRTTLALLACLLASAVLAAPAAVAGDCPSTPCCEGDLHEVTAQTRIFVGDLVSSLSVEARLRGDCAATAPVVDEAGVTYTGAFPGPVPGLNDVVTIQNVRVEAGMAIVDVQLTATGAAFPQGFFGSAQHRLEVTVNGTTNHGCTAFRCESVRPGSHFTWTDACGMPACDEPPPSDCGECKGKVTELILRYLGTTSAQVLVTQKDRKRQKTVFDGAVTAGGTFTIQGQDRNGTLGPEIRISVDDASHTTIHTSCSQPIGPGLVRGDFEIVSGQSRDGGLLCPLDGGAGTGGQLTHTCDAAFVVLDTLSHADWCACYPDLCDPCPCPIDCGDCSGKVTELTLRYDGGAPAQVTITQKAKRKQTIPVFDGLVGAGETFTIQGQDSSGTLGTEIRISVNGVSHTTIHTSCSQPIGPGLVRGDFTVVAGKSRYGGDLCPIEGSGECNCPGRIAGTVWRETKDCNGVIDAGEPGIPGVLVELTPVDPLGATVSTTTDASGNYLFDDLPPGIYAVSVDGGQPLLVDLDPTTSGMVDVTLLPDGTGSADFGYCPPAQVLGRVFRSPLGDCDGVYDDGIDQGIAGVTVTLSDGLTTTTTTTDADGRYWFLELDPGTYSVSVDGGQPQVVDLSASTPLTVGPFELLPDGEREVDFGFCAQRLSGTVFLEPANNCSGTLDAGDVPLGGVEVTLTKQDAPGAGDVRTTLTAPDGTYAFESIPAGSYTVEVTGGAPAGADPSTPILLSPGVALGDDVTDQDFGYCPKVGQIAGTVWRETKDCNGVIDAGEPGIPGVIVLLTPVNPAGPTLSTMTDANGNYVFPNLPAGEYSVSVDGGQPVLVDLDPTTPGMMGITLLPGGTGSADFGYCPPSRVLGVVYRQPVGDCDGVYDDGVDQGIPGVTVTLSDGSTTTTTTTNDQGEYWFDDLDPGTYTVSVDGGQPQVIDLSASTPLSVGPFVLPPDSEERADFGFCAQRLSGTVFLEPAKDCDGALGAGDVPLGGVEVTLTKQDAPGAGDVRTTLTAPDGTYSFESIPAGSYTVEVTGGAPADTDPSTAILLSPSVALGDHVMDQDFGYCPQLGRLGGTVWRETKDCNGVIDAGEPGIPGVSVVLMPISPTGPSLSTTTDALGNYAFEDLAQGLYAVSVNGGQPLLVDLDPTTPGVVDVDVLPGGDHRADFGYCPPSRILGVVYRQPPGDCDGAFDPGVDQGIAGVTVVLSDGTSTQTTTTNAGGEYGFDDLTPGSYTVSVDSGEPQLVNLGASSPLSVGPFVLPPDSVERVDFGFCAQRLSGTVFLEPFGQCDSVLNAGDIGIGGVEVLAVKLDQPGQGVLRTTMTAADGTYSFEGIPPGMYEISVAGTVLGGLDASTPDVLVPDVPVGGDVTDQDFGFCPPPDCGPCVGKVTELTLRYTGSTAATVTVVQRISGQQTGTVFSGVVQPGGLFRFTGQDKHGTLGPEIDVYVNGVLHTTIHTSCSQPIGPGLVRGDFTVISGKSRGGGYLCPVH